MRHFFDTSRSTTTKNNCWIPPHIDHLKFVQFTTNDGRFGYNELNLIHDGTTVDATEYGDMITGFQGSQIDLEPLVLTCHLVQ